MTKYMSEWLVPKDHNTQEHLLVTLSDRRASILFEVRKTITSYPMSPPTDWFIILNTLESDSSIYELLRDPIGRASLRLSPDRQGLVHPEEDLLMQLLDREEGPLLLLNCPESINLTSLEGTLEYLDKHKDSGMIIKGGYR